jgi:hypothetical protein
MINAELLASLFSSVFTIANGFLTPFLQLFKDEITNVLLLRW